MIAIGCDHAGYELKLMLKDRLIKQGYEVCDVGTDSTQSCDYPQFARAVSELVAEGKARYGILICGTGIGMSIVANKVKGIRAAVVGDEFSAKATREHNDANVLCLGARVTAPEKALNLMDIFLDTPFSEGENHIRRISQIEQ